MVFIFDTVHGYISIDDNQKVYIDNPWMKRLKRINQLGLLDHVFPSASHSRFEHSIGVAHLAEKYIERLVSNSQEFNPKYLDKFCVKLAGLFHDIGHGPFSHVFDNIIVKNPLLHHEFRSRNIVEYIFKSVGTTKTVSSAYMIDNIKEMIQPLHNQYLTNYNLRPLHTIVNNVNNGIDVDKLDYLLRDPNHIGLDYSFNYGRIFNKSYIINGNIVYDYSICNNIIDLFKTRYRFHKDIYNHKTVKLIEMMLGDALLESDNVFNFNDILMTPDFLKLDDSIYSQILNSDSKDLDRSKKILQRIENRDLYKLLSYQNLDVGDSASQMLEDLYPDYRESQIKYTEMDFSLCKNNHSPLSNVLFTSDKKKCGYLQEKQNQIDLYSNYHTKVLMIYNVN
tara:strand:- start:577 stop:1758 length:1182 start_codon:yes stop_codon:yes gene_type:complete